MRDKKNSRISGLDQIQIFIKFPNSVENGHSYTNHELRILIVIHIIKQDIVYMFPIAGQMAGPNGLKVFEETHK